MTVKQLKTIVWFFGQTGRSRGRGHTFAVNAVRELLLRWWLRVQVWQGGLIEPREAHQSACFPWPWRRAQPEFHHDLWEPAVSPKAVGLCPAEIDAVNYQLMQKLYSRPINVLYMQSHWDAQLHKLAVSSKRVQPRRTTGCGQRCWGADILTGNAAWTIKTVFQCEWSLFSSVSIPLNWLLLSPIRGDFGGPFLWSCCCIMHRRES